MILSAANIRPRARSRMQWDQLSVGQIVMVNYNPDHPTQRGYWYDAEVTRKVCVGGFMGVVICLYAYFYTAINQRVFLYNV